MKTSLLYRICAVAFIISLAFCEVKGQLADVRISRQIYLADKFEPLSYALEVGDLARFKVLNADMADDLIWELSVEKTTGGKGIIASSDEIRDGFITLDIDKIGEAFCISRPYNDNGKTLYKGELSIKKNRGSEGEFEVMDSIPLLFHLGPDQVEILSVQTEVGWDYSDNMVSDGSYITMTLRSNYSERIVVERYYPEEINSTKEATTRVGWDNFEPDGYGCGEFLHLCDTYWGVIYGFYSLNRFGSSFPILVNTRDCITDATIREEMAKQGAIFDKNVIVPGTNYADEIIYQLDGDCLRTDGQCLIDIYSTTGSHILSAHFNNEFSLSRLPEGLYIVSLNVDNKHASFKLLR